MIALAKQFGVSAAGDLRTAVIAKLRDSPPTVLVLDNLETVWLADGKPVAAVDMLLHDLAEIPSLWLIVTCRGSMLPSSVKWSNADIAAMQPFSLEAALQTFEDRTGRRFFGNDEVIVTQLLEAVDRMPLAVSLLGQLAGRGHTPSELLDRWSREHSELLRTSEEGRNNNAAKSIGLSVAMLSDADDSQESLQLLSVCSMLPGGLRPDIFEKLRRHFRCIDDARGNLIAYALVDAGADQVLRTLSPIRHLVLDRHPPDSLHHDVLCTAYLNIVDTMPIEVGPDFKERATDVAPEIENLSSLLLTLVNQPSESVVDAVVRLTRFLRWLQPSVNVACSLLPHLESYPKWKARCLQAIGEAQMSLCKYQLSVANLSAAASLFRQLGDLRSAACCMQAAVEPNVYLGAHEQARAAGTAALEIFIELEDRVGQAICGASLGLLEVATGNKSSAIDYYTEALNVFNAHDKPYYAAQCLVQRARAHVRVPGRILIEDATLSQDLNLAREVFLDHGDLRGAAYATRELAFSLTTAGSLARAEVHMEEAQALSKKSGNIYMMARCERDFGILRSLQGHPAQGAELMRNALVVFENLQVTSDIAETRELLGYADNYIVRAVCAVTPLVGLL